MICLLFVAVATAAISHKEMMAYKKLVNQECNILQKCPETFAATLGGVKCVNGMAGEYPCKNIDLLSYVPLGALGSNVDGNDIWGWTDNYNGVEKEYAIVCTVSGTSFVDISDPVDPLVLGFMPTQTENSLWRDAKVFGNFAYIVSEASGHGLQVFDLTRLRDLQLIAKATRRNNTDATIVTQLTPDAWYGEFGAAHNLFINEDTGVAYIVGSTQDSQNCNAVIHMIDVNNPLKPKFAGCLGEKDFNYCHDVQCVVYAGPDAKYQGKEICFGSMGDSIGIFDVSDRQSPVTLHKGTYKNLEFCHQGWLFEGQSRFAVNDEIDELMSKTTTHTRTIFYDVSDLNNPKMINQHFSPEEASDHNNYVIEKNGVEYITQSNYCAGLRVLKVDDAKTAKVSDWGHFDVAPLHTGAGFHGSWSNYPFFKSGIIVVNSIERGLFVLKPSL